MQDSMNAELVLAVRQALADNANPDKAEGMRAYMKSEMPYRGVQKPLRRKLFRALLRSHPIAEKVVWRDSVLELWRGAAYREERYMALELAGARQYLLFRTFDTLPMLEEMVVTGAWWDFVDEVATHRLRELLERYPKGMAQRMRSWSRNANMWKRRSAIICQVGRKERDQAWTNLETVESYVSRNQARLSALSRREALRNASKIRNNPPPSLL